MNQIASSAMSALAVVDCCTPLAGSSLDEDSAVDLEVVMKALADRHRLRIINMLSTADGEHVCLCEIQPTLGISQGTVSHHLKQLVEAGIIERETRGRYSYFTLVPGALDAVKDVFKAPAACC